MESTESRMERIRSRLDNEKYADKYPGIEPNYDDTVDFIKRLLSHKMIEAKVSAILRCNGNKVEDVNGYADYLPFDLLISTPSNCEYIADVLGCTLTAGEYKISKHYYSRWNKYMTPTCKIIIFYSDLTWAYEGTKDLPYIARFITLDNAKERKIIQYNDTQDINEIM